MNIQYCSDYKEMSQMASDSVISGLKEHSRSWLCTATGNSPIGLYEVLAKEHRTHPEYFKELGIVKLDEWGGIPMEDPSTCESHIKQKILQPLRIHSNRYISFKGHSTDPTKECERIKREIHQKGPIDICILGLGKNGHLGFNEPADRLEPYCHVAHLSEESQQHQMVHVMTNKPTYGLTLGMADILASKKILLLITGSGKEQVMEELMSAKISTHLPASFLWVHPNVNCYVDLESFPGIRV